MVTLLRIDGFEFGNISGAYGTPDIGTGTPTIVSSPVRTGDWSLEISPAGSAESVAWDLSVVPTISAVAFYFRFTTLPADNDAVVAWSVNAGSSNAYIRFDTGTNKFYLDSGGTTSSVGGPTISVDTWYRLVAELDTATSTVETLRCRIDTSTEMTVTSSESGSGTHNNILIGDESGTTTWTVYIDDLIISVTNGDYETIRDWTSHQIESLRPTSDGTHSISGANEIERSSSGTDITNATTTAYQLLDDLDATDSTDWVNDVGVDTASYVEVLFEDVSDSGLAVVGVRAIERNADSSNVGANTAHSDILLSDDTLITPGLRLTTDDPGTGGSYNFKLLDAPSGGWDGTKLNGLKYRCGYGDGSPDAYFYVVLIEAVLVVTFTDVAISAAHSVASARW